MIWVYAVLVAFLVTLATSCGLDYHLNAHYLNGETKRHFSVYTMWSHAYCGMTLMLWLAAAYNCRCVVGLLRVPQPSERVRAPLVVGIVIAIGVLVTLVLRTYDLTVPLKDTFGETIKGPGGKSIPCVPLGGWPYVASIGLVLFLAVATSIAIKVHALLGVVRGHPHSVTLDNMLQGLFLEIGVSVFVVLEIGMIWMLFAQCDPSFLPSPSSKPYTVALHFANAASIGMCIVVGLPSAAILLVAKSLPQDDASSKRIVAKAKAAFWSGIAPAIVGALAQAMLS